MTHQEKLTVREYFEQLELEYFSYLFRSLIYEEPCFIQICKDICEKKKDKIMKIGHQYQLTNIFKNVDEWNRVLRDLFLQPYGMPALKYNPGKRSSFYYDRLHAFKPGRQVKYQGKVLTVKNNYPDRGRIDVKVGKGKIISLRYIDVELLVDNLFK